MIFTREGIQQHFDWKINKLMTLVREGKSNYKKHPEDLAMFTLWYFKITTTAGDIMRDNNVCFMSKARSILRYKNYTEKQRDAADEVLDYFLELTCSSPGSILKRNRDAEVEDGEPETFDILEPYAYDHVIPSLQGFIKSLKKWINTQPTEQQFEKRQQKRYG